MVISSLFDLTPINASSYEDFWSLHVEELEEGEDHDCKHHKHYQNSWENVWTQLSLDAWWISVGLQRMCLQLSLIRLEEINEMIAWISFVASDCHQNIRIDFCDCFLDLFYEVVKFSMIYRLFNEYSN